MNSIQYEELCRFFLADKLGISIEKVQSVTIPNSRRPNLPEYKHQIDLYWEDGNEVALYLNIANVKWRSSGNVNLGDILLLQKVKEKVAAHKSMMITSIGFDKGAKAAAKDEGVALHIVRPNFDRTILDLNLKNRESIQTHLQKLITNGESVYAHEIVHRAFEFGTSTAVQPSGTVKTSVHSRGIAESPSNRMRQSPSDRSVPSYTKKAPNGQGQVQQRFSRNTGRGANRGG